MSDDPTDLEFAQWDEWMRGKWYAENVPASAMPDGCPCLVIRIPLEGPVVIEVEGDIGRLCDWLIGHAGHLAAAQHGLNLAKEGRGE